MPNTIVKLSKPITEPTIRRQLEFREPKYRELMELGDPFRWVRISDPGAAPEDAVFSRVDDTEKLDAYAQRLIMDGDQRGDALWLEELGVEDTGRVKRAILRFFPEAGLGPEEPSTTSPTTSSSTSDGQPST